MNRWLRTVKHRWAEAGDVHRALPPAAIERLTQRVRDSERRHSGEIRICIEAGLPLSYLWRNAPARERAIMMFAKLRVWDTEHDNGVLIYLLLADHAIEIVADRGIAAKVDENEWRDVCELMRTRFADGDYEGGAIAGVEAINAILVRHFPANGQHNPDELPDRPVLL